MSSIRKIRKAVFPVAGLGTRFLPATKSIPKEMLTVVDKPVIQYVVDEAREAGIEHLIFVTGRNKAVIEDYFDAQVELYSTLAERGKKAELEHLQELQPQPGTTSFTRQQVPLGLGHAVWCARELVGDEPFALLLPDMVMQSKKGCLKEMAMLLRFRSATLKKRINTESLARAMPLATALKSTRWLKSLPKARHLPISISMAAISFSRKSSNC
ncbi:UTP--glucose-1-phosphate uridylyltransferase [compost metagenome]